MQLNLTKCKPMHQNAIKWDNNSLEFFIEIAINWNKLLQIAIDWNKSNEISINWNEVNEIAINLN